ncbi:MAG TPA: 4-amino-4-deoxychorismate lyase [Cyanobacteria bacterium UBA8543]|nr:4-amino-4-deoxychorismate lyase [Cyanobacteria bacterium UBA8543]
MFWYNGGLVKANTLELAIDNPGLLYGATVFTTLRVYHQSLESPLTNWRGHCDRLFSSLQAFGWQLPDIGRLHDGAQTLSAFYPVVRITIFPDGREWITGRSLPSDLAQRQQLGVRAWLADAPEYRRSLPAHKTGNYLAAWLAQQASRQLGAAEAILVDADGNWLETSTGNLWGWKDSGWWTPPLTAGLLPGVVRSQLKVWLKAQGSSVQEMPWDSKLVQEFEAIAYTNSVVELIPIHTVLQEHTTLTYDPFHSTLEQLRSLFCTVYHKDTSN